MPEGTRGCHFRTIRRRMQQERVEDVRIWVETALRQAATPPAPQGLAGAAAAPAAQASPPGLEPALQQQQEAPPPAQEPAGAPPAAPVAQPQPMELGTPLAAPPEAGLPTQRAAAAAASACEAGGGVAVQVSHLQPPVPGARVPAPC